MQTMHGGREELVPKYQISPVTHPVSAVLRVYIMILQTLDIRDTRQCKDPGVPRRVLSTSLLMALLLYIVGPDTSGRVLSSSDMLRTEPGRDHRCQCMASM